MIKACLVGIVLLFSSLASAQGVKKHPRVSELEAQLQHDVSRIVESRFPGRPNLISIEIEPLRRIPVSGLAAAEGDKLPYYDLSDVEIIDEWDDPRITIYELMSRIRRAKVEVSVPDDIKSEHIAEMKEMIIKSLRLIPGRDEVIVAKKPWGDKPFDLVQLGAGVGFVLFFLFGLWAVLRLSLPKAGRQKDSEGNQKSPRPTPSPMPLNSQAAFPSASGVPASASGGMNLQLNDSLKVREFVLSTMSEFAEVKGFPCLQDMLLLEKLGQESVRELGSLLMEFPHHLRERIFALSFGSNWLEALYNPGELSSRSMSCVESLMRNHQTEHNNLWEELLIRVWRLKGDKVEFVRSLQREESFAILNSLPKSVGVPLAREAYPGGWGVLLDPSYKTEDIEAARMQELIDHLKEIDPDRDLKVLEQFKKDKELLDYLKGAGIQEEKEIYEASPSTSMIHQIRPPFYVVLEQSEDIYDVLVRQFSLDQWVLALFNVPREIRKSIEKRFDEKQHYLYVEKMKALDKNPPSSDAVEEVRQRIATALKDALVLLEGIEAQAEDADEVSATEGADFNEVSDDDAEAA